MKKQPNVAIRALRKIIGQTQAEFAAMIGVSKDAVVSWETGRNQVSDTYMRRIALATGVDGRMLKAGVSVPFSQAADGHPYAAEDFERHRQSEWGRTDEEGARRWLEHGADTLELLLLAAAKPSGDKQRHQLPGVMDAFMQWCEAVREDFQLGPAIDAQLAARRRPVGMTQAYRDWRAMSRGNPEGLKANGFADDPTKGDREELRLEVEMVPEWAPGRSMKWPNPSRMKLAMPAQKAVV
jgi:transcriptional regulator with XRE-family HTH domain